MKRAKKRRSTKRANPRRSGRRATVTTKRFTINPHRRRSRPRKTARRKNPSVRSARGVTSSAVNNVVRIVKYLGIGYANGVVTREGAQMILNNRNNGLMGYGTMLAITAVSSWLVRSFFGKAEAIAAATGGGLAMVERYRSEMANPVVGNMSAPLSGVGDANTFAAGARIRSALAGVPRAVNPGGALRPAMAPAPRALNSVRTMAS